MDTWQIIVLVLAAVLVGAVLPLMALMSVAVVSLKRRIEETGERLDKSLDSANRTLVRIEEVSRGLEGGQEQVSHFVDSIGRLADALDTIGKNTKIASAISSAVVPAVTAFVSTMRKPQGNGESEKAESDTAGTKQTGMAEATSQGD